MIPKQVNLCVIYTTPKQLRALADRLDDRLTKTRLGEDMPTETFYPDGNAEVRFAIDQDELHREKRA